MCSAHACQSMNPCRGDKGSDTAAACCTRQQSLDSCKLRATPSYTQHGTFSQSRTKHTQHPDAHSRVFHTFQTSRSMPDPACIPKHPQDDDTPLACCLQAPQSGTETQQQQTIKSSQATKRHELPSGSSSLQGHGRRTQQAGSACTRHATPNIDTRKTAQAFSRTAEVTFLTKTKGSGHAATGNCRR